MRLAICGPGRAGKDVAADFLMGYGFRYSGSTSVVISREIARREGISFEEAHARRHAERKKWYREGNRMRRSDPARLVREVIVDSDLVVGVRDRCEIEIARDEGLVDLVLWIDRPVPRDPTLKYGKEVADAIIPNRWGIPEFHRRLARLARSWGRSPQGLSLGGLGATEIPGTPGGLDLSIQASMRVVERVRKKA